MTHQMNSLDDLYLNQLQDNYSANKQMAGVVGEFQTKASDEKLKLRLNEIKDGVQRHNETLKTVIEGRGGRADGEHCKGMEGLVNEGRAHGLEPQFGDPSVQDAAMIAQVHRMSHYGVAGYGTAKAFAEQLGYQDDAQKLDSSLGDIYDSEEFLSSLAEKRVNVQADS